MNITLNKIYRLFEARDYQKAVNLCNALLSEEHDNEFTAEVLRERAMLFNCLGELDDALNDYLRVLRIVEVPKVADYYFSGCYSVRLQQYKKALTYLNDGIILTCDRRETYYLSSLLFVKAYALYKVRAFDQAEEALEDIEEDFKLWIENPKVPLKKSELLKLIKEKCQ